MVFRSRVAVAAAPSQLYQFALEGVFLFVILWIYGRKPRGSARSAAPSRGLRGTALLRRVLASRKFPGSAHLGMSMGQWLCLPMIAAGVALWAGAAVDPRGRRRRPALRPRGLTGKHATDRPLHRNDRAQPRVGRPHHRDRLRGLVNRRLTGGRFISTATRTAQQHRCLQGARPVGRIPGDKPLFAHIVDECRVRPRCGDHHPQAAFDIGFLDVELRRIGRPCFTSHALRICDSLSMARDSFPGKSNSLDALCKRLEVNNSGRELHGALLDAGLLAEVYIRMTRGQGALVIDSAARSTLTSRPNRSTFCALVCRHRGRDEKLVAHAALLPTTRPSAVARSGSNGRIPTLRLPNRHRVFSQR